MQVERVDLFNSAYHSRTTAYYTTGFRSGPPVSPELTVLNPVKGSCDCSKAHGNSNTDQVLYASCKEVRSCTTGLPSFLSPWRPCQLEEKWEREKEEAAADLLAEVTRNCKMLVAYMKSNHPDEERVKRLVKNFNPQKVMETLPTSELTAYSENKGEKIAFCLNKKKKNPSKLIDIETLTFVAIHELAHTMTASIGHKQEFWDNFKYLLENAKEAGIHDPVDYGKKPEEYCGMTITDNPYYDL